MPGSRSATASRKRRTSSLALAAEPIGSRSASQPFDTDGARFIAAVPGAAAGQTAADPAALETAQP